MKKKLLAVAVVGALASPVAFAQVTIGGAVRVSVDNLKYSQPAATRTTTSESRLNDESSSIIFNMREDLGQGLAAIVLVDVKPNIDTSAIAASGQSYIGLQTTFGRFTAGRHNFHFFKAPYDGYGLGGSLKLMPAGIIDHTGGGKVAIANATRTNNSLMYSSPSFGGFAVDAGYSFNPGGAAAAEADMSAGNTARKGQAWYLNPAFTMGNWHVAWSHWNGKTDAATGVGVATADQVSNSLYGYINVGAFKVGAIWNTTELKAPTVGTKVSERDAWSIPVRFTAGRNSFLAHYTVANDDDVIAGENGAKMWVFAFAHSLSKRTSVQLAYAKLTNESAAAYDFFTNTSGGGLSSVNAGSGAGEDARLLTFGMVHSF